MSVCLNFLPHSAVLWPRDADGVPACPFDAPILTPIFGAPEQAGVYWDHAAEVVTSFADATRTAHEYTRDGTDIGARPYTDEENTRADALDADRALSQALLDFERASAVNSAPAELEALQAATLAAEGIEPGDPWRQPTGAHDAYPLGAVVTHNAATWESTVAANVWEPGVSGWRATGTGPQPWVQPTGAHDAYPKGALVTHIGKTWESNVDANVWEPPEQWTEVQE